MDTGARTAAVLDLGPSLETYDVTVSTATVTATADLAADLRHLVAGSPPGGLVGVAAFASLREVEPLAYYVGALTTVVPALVGAPVASTAFQLADPSVFARQLRQVGLSDLGVRTTTRWLWFDSARHLLDAVMRTDPIATRRLEELTERQLADVEQVLDGMFRERSDGTRGAVLRAVINVGRGRIAPPTTT